MDLPTALVALIVVAVIAYIVTVVHAATTRTLGRTSEPYRPEERLFAWPKWLSGLIGVLLVIWLLYQVRGILLPFILGAVIAYLLNPGIARIERRGTPRGRAIALVFCLFLVVFVGAILLLAPIVANQADDLIRDYDKNLAAFETRIAAVEEFLERRGADLGILPQDMRLFFANARDAAAEWARGVVRSIPAILNRSIALISLLVITPIVTYWVLRDYQRLGRKALRAIPEPRRSSLMDLLGEINKLVGSYLLGMAIMVVIVAIYASIVLVAAGVKFAALLGMITGVLYLIPYIGFPAAVIIVAIAMTVTGHSLVSILIVFVFYVLGNIASDYLITPRVVGGRVGLHPLVVIFSLLAGAALLGVVGMVLAVPTAGAIKVVLLRFWPELFTPGPPDAGDSQQGPEETDLPAAVPPETRS
ncbi:MAG: AI-2E family transporter [Armatimonadota bacterium]